MNEDFVYFWESVEFGNVVVFCALKKFVQTFTERQLAAGLELDKQISK